METQGWNNENFLQLVLNGRVDGYGSSCSEVTPDHNLLPVETIIIDMTIAPAADKIQITRLGLMAT